MTTVIQVERLSKLYRIGAGERGGHRTLRETIMAAVGAPWGWLRARSARLFEPEVTKNGKPSDGTIWALKDVCFEIPQGEVVGIIGRNGAGKSTLLKILSRITEPTSGRVVLRGRVGSLLEVGTGFHGELTGRENIFLNGAILGMSRREIARKFDPIVAFAEIEQFLDTPVKRYSSGMYMRLAFAVAAHLEPDILLVDEVLAVGDLAFQKKCLGKMQEVSRQGRTVVFISHNMAAILNLCGKVALLDRGRLVFLGGTEEAVQRYMDACSDLSGGDVDLSAHLSRRPGCLPLLKRVRLVDGQGRPKNRFLSGEKLVIELEFDPAVPLQDPQFGIGVDDWMGIRIFSLATYLSDSRLPVLGTACKVTCTVDELPLAQGRYALSLSAGPPDQSLLDALDHAISFEVDPSDFFKNGRMPHPSHGKVLVRSRWEKKGP